MEIVTPTIKRRISQRGFTLIELLMVIAIIGLLASITLTSVATVRDKARDTRRVTDVKQLAGAVELYRLANGTYPVATVPTLAIPGVSPTYVSSIPAAPSPPAKNCTSTQNQYLYQSDGTNYGIQFCIGGSVGSIGSGVGVVSDKGAGLRYDVNGDGVVDNNDPNYIAQYIVQLVPTCPLYLCDINGDGAIFANDAALLAQIIAGS